MDYAVWKTNKAGFRDVMVAACRAMMGNSKAVETTVQEAGLFGKAWGFGIRELADEVQGRLALWHGERDVNVLCRMAVEAKELLGEGVELRVEEGLGHVSLVCEKADEVVRTVVGMMQRR